MYEIICEQCGDMFMARYSYRKFCSIQCASFWRWQNEREKMMKNHYHGGGIAITLGRGKIVDHADCYLKEARAILSGTKKRINHCVKLEGD